jgi:hypothetical protein
MPRGRVIQLLGESPLMRCSIRQKKVPDLNNTGPPKEM